jgi:hypothetical protein
MPPTAGAVMFAAGASALVMGWRVLQAGRRRHVPLLSRPRGSVARGVAYAMGPGLSPWAKESGRRHPVVLVLGMAFHLGVFAGCAWLVWGLTTAAPLPAPLLWTAVLAAGALSGLGLLVRRLRSPVLRGISVPDDIVSNVLTTAFVALAGATVLWSSALVPFHVVAVALLLYAPIGKIRHCVFFFIARVRFGAWFGHRGVLPPHAHGAQR